MSYEVFCRKVQEFVRKSGGDFVEFNNDEEIGRYTAKCGNVTIFGNPASLKVTVWWGNRHQAMVEI